MNTSVDRVAAVIDSKLSMLGYIKDVNSTFYNEFVREFLTDRLTFIGFERDLVNALEAVAGIRIYRKEDTIFIQYKLRNGAKCIETVDSYEAAFRFAMGLLHIR